MLVKRVDAYLRRTKIAATRFGRDAVGDPNFVLELRDGRKPRRKTVERVLAFLDAVEPSVSRQERAR
jgi:2,4-dienoyl-CoA reductase-like NADH-dependent reductase (Old Yellow Enzyme family)